MEYLNNQEKIEIIKIEFKNYNILTVDKKTSNQDLYKKLIKADIIFHLAGVNRETNPKYNYDNNYVFAKKICSFLENNYKNLLTFILSKFENELNLSTLITDSGLPSTVRL